MKPIAITGAGGRMGRALVAAIAADSQVQLGAALVRPASRLVGLDAQVLGGAAPTGDEAQVGCTISSDLPGGIANSDCLIDFTTPDACLAVLPLCVEAQCPMVIGTTGFSPDQLAEIDRASAILPIVLAPNMSVGVNLALQLIRLAAQALGDDADVEILEAHHRGKRDAPSGTAVRMGEVVAAATGRELDEVALYGRQGLSEPRDRKTIGFSTVRAGDIVGEHTVLFATSGERLEITHRASSRHNFASGAVRAAKWLVSQRPLQPGRYDMGDVLG